MFRLQALEVLGSETGARRVIERNQHVWIVEWKLQRSVNALPVPKKTNRRFNELIGGDYCLSFMLL